MAVIAQCKAAIIEMTAGSQYNPKIFCCPKPRLKKKMQHPDVPGETTPTQFACRYIDIRITKRPPPSFECKLKSGVSAQPQFR